MFNIKKDSIHIKEKDNIEKENYYIEKKIKENYKIKNFNMLYIIINMFQQIQNLNEKPELNNKPIEHNNTPLASVLPKPFLYGSLNIIPRTSDKIESLNKNITGEKLEILNLNKNIGLKDGILLSYNKIISYNYNKSQSILYYNNKYKSTIINKILINNRDIFNINKILISFFKSIYCIISKPVFIHTGDKVIIQIFYYLNIPKKKIFRLFSILYKKGFKYKWIQNIISKKSKKIKLRIKKKNRKSISRLRKKSNKIRNILFYLRKWSIIKYYKNKLKILCDLLSKQFNKNVELQLIRLHNPNYDSNILVNLLSINLKNKHKKSRRAIQNIYNKNSVKIIKDYNLKSVNSIPSFISGLNIKIAGRLMREPIIPRITTKVIIKGASSPGKVNYLDIASITNKNRKGAYTITIKSGQNFFPLA